MYLPIWPFFLMNHTASELLTQKNAENTAEIIICPAEMKQVSN